MTDPVASPTSDLVPVHGGLAAPIDRVVSLKERRRFLDEAARLPRLRVSKADLSTVHRFADGALSPCEGPMRESLWHEVLDRASIAASDGRRYA